MTVILRNSDLLCRSDWVSAAVIGLGTAVAALSGALADGHALGPALTTATGTLSATSPSLRLRPHGAAVRPANHRTHRAGVHHPGAIGPAFGSSAVGVFGKPTSPRQKPKPRPINADPSSAMPAEPKSSNVEVYGAR
jgi:hypothetical protein